jgi:putative hydrolase of the HAD superfamily
VTVGYLFDLDRTLVTYEPDVSGIFRTACSRAGVEPTPEAADVVRSAYIETFLEFEESPYLGAARALRESGMDIDPSTFAATYVEAELEATQVPPGVVDLVASLDRVGVVTNGYGPVQRRKLDATGLADRVDAVVCADDVEAFKPRAAPFDAITDALDAEEYVMVGDNVEYDIEPANERGYRTVFVGPEGGETADYRLPDPASLSALPVILHTNRPTPAATRGPAD